MVLYRGTWTLDAWALTAGTVTAVPDRWLLDAIPERSMPDRRT